MLLRRAHMHKRTESSHRDLILDIVRRTDEQPMTDAVFMRARASVPTISLTTVYRNPRRLVADGRLRERMFGGADVAADGPALIRHFKASLQAWTVDHVDVELRGRCPTCRNKIRSPKSPTPSPRVRPRTQRHPGRFPSSRSAG